MTTITRRHFMGTASMLGAMGTLSAFSFNAVAQAAWPATTKITVPLPPGGPVDVMVRKLGELMAPKLNSAVLIENKLGASGLIAAKSVANAAADGSNIFYIHSGLLTVQAITGRLDILSEFKPVTKIASSPHVLMVNNASPYKTMADLIAAMKAKPGKLNFGSGGLGSPTHLCYEWLEELVPGSVKATHIPFKGGPDAVVALLQGEIDFLFVLPSLVAEHIKAGKLRALAVTSAKRMPLLPNVATVAEAGAPGYAFEPWGGLVVPAKTSDAVVAQLFEATKVAVAAPDFIALNNRTGSHIELSASPAAFAEFIRTALPIEKKMVVKLGLKAE